VTIGGGNVTATIPAGAGTGRECDWCAGPLPKHKKRFCSDDHRRRGQKRERVTENDQYAGMIERYIGKMGVRASADLYALAWLAGAVDHARDALALAVAGCRSMGYSDTEVGVALGYPREFARQAVGARFGRRKTSGDCSDDHYTGPAESGDPA